MPNWCEGTLKVRGEQENIKKFLMEGLVPIQPAIVQLLRKDIEKPQVTIEEDEYYFSMKADQNADGFHIKGTHRNFIDCNFIEWDKNRSVLIIDGFKAAWGIDVAPYIQLSKEYSIDIRIYGFEKGMEFNQEIEVHKGELIKDEEIKFSDYEWECIKPSLGG